MQSTPTDASGHITPRERSNQLAPRTAQIFNACSII
jgi:hypothetical protein